MTTRTDHDEYMFLESEQMGLNRALDLWVDPGIDQRELGEAERAQAREKAQRRIEELGLEASPRMFPIFWLRLFLEARIAIAPAAVHWLTELEREREREDKVRLYKRYKVSAGTDRKFISRRAERFPGVFMRGFTTLEALLEPPTSKADWPGSWPYREQWKTMVRRRPTAKTPSSVALESATKTWSNLTLLLRPCLEQMAKKKGPSGAKLITKIERPRRDQRPFSSSVKVEVLIEALQTQFPDALAMYATSTLRRVIPTYVSSNRGRPLQQPKGKK